MNAAPDILTEVRRAAGLKILYLPHAVKQMARPDRMISASTIRETLASGVLVEDYPSDARGHSCLLLGRDEAGQPIHVVCAPKPDYLAVITAYRPDPAAWEADLRTRKRL